MLTNVHIQTEKHKLKSTVEEQEQQEKKRTQRICENKEYILQREYTNRPSAI